MMPPAAAAAASSWVRRVAAAALVFSVLRLGAAVAAACDAAVRSSQPIGVRSHCRAGPEREVMIDLDLRDADVR